MLALLALSATDGFAILRRLELRHVPLQAASLSPVEHVCVPLALHADAESERGGAWRADLCTSAHPGGAKLGVAGFVQLQRRAGCPSTAACVFDGARVNGSDSDAPIPALYSASKAACRPPLANGSSDALLRVAYGFGPDEVFVMLEGSELLVLSGAHEGRCAYTFPFVYSVAGELVRVALLLVRRNWDALNEAIATFPPLAIEDADGMSRPLSISGDRLLVRIGTRARAAAALNDSTAATMLAQEVLDEDARDAAARGTALPPCGLGDIAGAGRWVRSRSVAGMFDAGSAWYAPPNRHELGVLQYYTELNQDLVWAPFACAQTPPAAAVVRAQLRHLGPLMFRGDSQLRTMYNDLWLRVCGTADAASKGLLGDVCVTAASNSSCEGLASCFLSDPNGAESTALNAASTTLVVNYGQHAASAAHVTAAAYAERVHAYIANLTAALAAGHVRRVVWVETQPFPIRVRDPDTHKWCDWRTHPRLALFNAAAAAAIADAAATHKVAVRVLPTWDALLPLVDANADPVAL